MSVCAALSVFSAFIEHVSSPKVRCVQSCLAQYMRSYLPGRVPKPLCLGVLHFTLPFGLSKSSVLDAVLYGKLLPHLAHVSSVAGLFLSLTDAYNSISQTCMF